MTAHILIPIPVGEVLKPSINPTAGLVIKRPQSDLNGLCDDDFFHDSLPLSDGDRSQNLMIVHFLGENSAAIWPLAQTLASDDLQRPLLVALRCGHALGYSPF